ncbi:Vacuolar-processing enzyme [Bienertia sinuspersici]
MRNEGANKFKFFGKDDSILDAKNWALLIATSNGYDNYRHQADVCHAYQLLRRNGLADENIIVFMYDDIAFHQRKGDAVNPNNFFAVLSGDATRINGGSGKVLNSGPDDQIFLYWSGHGADGMLGNRKILAEDLVDALWQKAASKSFDTMLIYAESCFSGSMFSRLPTNLNIYVTTAANENENSYATHCYVDKVFDDVCLADEYSIAWIEHRTPRSHVMKYGDPELDGEILAVYFGRYSGLLDDKDSMKQPEEPITKNLELSLDQQEASFQSLVLAVLRAPNGTREKEIAIEELHQEVAHRAHIDCVIEQIAKAISSPNDFWWLIDTYAPNLVDDWNCYRTLLSTYETYCGGFSMYGVKYGHVFANMCNNGTQQSQLAEVASEVCGDQGKC